MRTTIVMLVLVGCSSAPAHMPAECGAMHGATADFDCSDVYGPGVFAYVPERPVGWAVAGMDMCMMSLSPIPAASCVGGVWRTDAGDEPFECVALPVVGRSEQPTPDACSTLRERCPHLDTGCLFVGLDPATAVLQ